MEKSLIRRTVWIAVIAWTALSLSAQPLPYDPLLRKGTLANGLTYYIYPNQNPKGEAVYRLFVKSGSVQERDDQQGLAHFLEHLAFNGTRHFPGDGIVKFLESRGAKFGKDLNAHTSFTETVYKLQLPSSDPLLVDSTMTILADWADGLLIEPEEVEKERGVILSEWLSRGGTKTSNSMKLVMELLNGSRYASRITIGDTAIIRHASPQTIRDYYEYWYHPSLMAVAVVGDIDADRIEKLIRKKFSHLNASKKGPELKTWTIPEYQDEKVTISTEKGVTNTKLDILMLLPQPPAVQTAEDYQQYLVRSLINKLFKQRFNALSFDNPAYSEASVQYSRFLGATGATDASVELQEGKIKEGIIDFIRHQQQIYQYGFTKVEIARVKKSMLSAMRNSVKSRQNRSSVSLMDEIYADYYEGNRLISREEELRLMEFYLPQADSVGLLRQIQQVFETRPMHYLLRGGEEVNREITTDQLRTLLNEVRSRPVSRYYKNVDIPDELCSIPYADHIVSEKGIPDIDAVNIQLDNGVRVIFRHQENEKERIVLSGFRKGGQYGVDSLQYYTSLVGPSVISLSGAGNYNRDELNYYLTGNTASVRMLVDKLRTGVAASARMQDVETMFQMLWLKWTQPRLDTSVCRLTIEKLVENYRQKKETPNERFSRRLGWLMNGRNYTNEVLTDSLVLHTVNPDDMIPLYHRFFGNAAGYTFIIISDCQLEDIRPLISTYLGGLPNGQADTTWVVSTRHIPQHPVELICHEAQDQKANVMLVYQQDRLGNEDPGMLEIKAEMLKAVLRSILLKRLREEMGKVYSVSVSSASGPYPSFLSRTSIAFVCQPSDVDMLIDTVQSELQRFYAHPEQFADYLEDVKKNLIKENALQKQKSSYWTSWIRNAVYYNRENWDFLNHYDESVNSQTVNDIARFARWAISDANEIKAVLLP